MFTSGQLIQQAIMDISLFQTNFPIVGFSFCLIEFVLFSLEILQTNLNDID